MSDIQDTEIEQIAVIGMACRFPEAGNIDEFWKNLCDGKESVTQFSDEELLNRGVTLEELSHPDYVKSGVVLNNIDLFDAEFFGYTARQAEIMDPQQRIFLEVAWEALENAGCNPETYDGSIGVIGGTGGNDYRKRIGDDLNSIGANLGSFQSMISNDPDYLTTRVAYTLNLDGPCYTLQTACSTSLVAVHVACQNLLMYQCDVVLAGGVSIRLPQGVGYRYQEGMIWSQNGQCRAFDSESRGIMLGRGAGIVVLKRLSEALEEGDHIYAVLKASAVNNDGAIKVGFTAPSVDGQAAVISMAQELADISPETISYVETHGTGTPLGDPIEVEALTKVFHTKTIAKNSCAIGSVKTNIGHLDAAAGVAALIKTALSLKNQKLPPSLNFKKPNPNIDFANSPFYVNTELRDWKSDNGPLRAGVSSFGIGGTNAHIVMEESPRQTKIHSDNPWQLLLLSAKYEEGVGKAATNLARYLQDNPEMNLADVAYTLQAGRKHFEYKYPIVCKDVEQAVELLSGKIRPIHTDKQERQDSRVAFMFSGQGSQYVSMCEELYKVEPVFRKEVDCCLGILNPLLEIDLFDVLFPNPEGVSKAKELINQTRITQPALFVIEYSLAKLMESWGIIPEAMVGHSIGEYVAACLAGVFTLEDALTLVVKRGKMMQELSPGSMLAVPLSESDVIPLLPTGVSVAVINGPAMTVVSGTKEVIADFKEKLAQDHEIEGRIILTSHAFHSYMMDPIVDKFADAVALLSLNEPQIPFVSNVSGTWITKEEATSPKYWASHLRKPVRFYSCVDTLLVNGSKLLIEVGPGQVLTNLAKQHPASKDCLVLSTTRRPVERKNDVAVLYDFIGNLWAGGKSINLTTCLRNESNRKVPLPTYPFKQIRHWITVTEHKPSHRDNTSQEFLSSTETDHLEVETQSILRARNDLEMQVSEIFVDLLGVQKIDVRHSFFDMGGDSLLAVRLLGDLRLLCEAEEITLADVFEKPSVEELATLIEKGGGRVQSKILPLNKGAGSQRIYFVVGIHIYRNLAEELSSIAKCYGVYLPIEVGLFGTDSDTSDWAVSDLATAYCEEISKHSNGEPISLVGISFGGVVAYEIARQLTQAGQTVQLLTMLDSLLPSGIRHSPFKWGVAQTKIAFKQGLGPIKEKVMGKVLKKIDKAKGSKASDAIFDAEIPDQRMFVYEKAVDQFEAAATRSKPIYSGKTLLIQAEDAVRRPGDSIDSHYGWKKHITGEFIVHSSPGDHLGILTPPNVKITADCIESVLRTLSKS